MSIRLFFPWILSSISPQSDLPALWAEAFFNQDFLVSCLETEKYLMVRSRLIIWIGVWLAIGAMGCGPDLQRGKLVYQQYCGGCHKLPAPGLLSRSVWEETVLPEMASRLGLSINGYDPYEGLSWVNKSLISQTGTYPEQPLLSAEEYNLLHQYVISQAPTTPDPGDRPKVMGGFGGFQSERIVFDQMGGANISMIQYDSLSHEFKVGTIDGELMRLKEGLRDTVAVTYSPVAAWSSLAGEELIAEMGILPPSQIREGGLAIRKEEDFLPIARALHRPVDLEVADLDDDGHEEIVVCEYGDYSGALTLWQQGTDGGYSSQSLLDVPGAIRVLTEDMNADGNLDLVVAFGQGNEGVFIFYQEDSLTFLPQQVIQAEAVYGTSWMELVDVDRDGDLDVILAQGDNADYSYELKPYHGVRIYLNDGKNQFEEAYFFPVYGATRVVAQDFDEDGDVDLAICAYFPDFAEGLSDSFIYLDHKDGADLDFEPYHLEDGDMGRWITAEAGDFDGDGDIDLLLGSFTHTPTPVPMDIKVRWNVPEAPDILLLRNTLR